MRHIIFLSIVFFCSFIVKAQEIDHPTISSLEINYTEDPASDLIPDSVKKVRLNAHITLKNVAGVSKVHFKIKNSGDNTLVYEIAYATDATPIVNDAGVTLFRKDGEGIVHISSPSLVPLAAYRYDISTEDGNALESEIYLSIQ